MKKSERLLTLLTILRGRRTAITASALAQRVNVSERTIYRDIESLILSGVDIQGEAGIGYQIMPGSAIPPLMFNQSEIESLMLGIRLVKSLADDGLSLQADQALEKIKAVLPDRLLHELNHKHTKFLVPDFQRQEKVRFSNDIRKAIEANLILEIHYVDAKEQTSSRQIWPLGLVFWGANWTLIAWCELRQDYRSFRLDRLQSVDVLEKGFQTNDTINLKAYLKQYDDNVSTGFWDI